MKLLSTSHKIELSNRAGLGYLTKCLYLAPYRLSEYNVCPQATNGCSATCLNTAGRGAQSNVQKARINKTKLLFNNRKEFLSRLHRELENFVKLCYKKQLYPAIRLNGTSDLDWLRIDKSLFSHAIHFYDYTKVRSRYENFLEGKLPKNYHLTFSRSEKNEDICLNFLKQGGTVAVVFNNKPKKWKGFPVFNGDEHDLRILDKPGVCGLKAKGKAKKDLTGFVIWTN